MTISRPVAAPVWLKLVCSRPVRGSISAGSASTYVPFSLVSWRYSSTLRTISCSSASSSSTSAAVEIVLPLPYFTGRRQPQILEQHAPKLLRRADVERLPRQLVDLHREPRNFGFHQLREPLQLERIDQDAGEFHARQHARQRQLDRSRTSLRKSARVDFRAHSLVQFERVIGVLLGRGP